MASGLCRDTSELTARKSLNSAYRAWADAYQNARAYIELDKSCPETFQSTEESYKEGKVERQDLLDAQKTWLDTKAQTLDAAADYHNKMAETLRLIAQLPLKGLLMRSKLPNIALCFLATASLAATTYFFLLPKHELASEEQEKAMKSLSR